MDSSMQHLNNSQSAQNFDQATMVETARIVSIEGAALVERQTSAVLGDIKILTKQIQVSATGSPQLMVHLM